MATVNQCNDRFQMLQQELKAADVLKSESLDARELMKRIGAIEASAKAVQESSGKLQFFIGITQKAIAPTLGAIQELEHRYAADKTGIGDDFSDEIQRIIGELSHPEQLSADKLNRIADVTAEFERVSQSEAQFAEIMIRRARLQNAHVLSVAFGFTTLAAFIEATNALIALSVDLPLPPNKTLKTLHDDLYTLLKVAGPLINPAGTAVAVAVVEVCKWLRRKLEEGGPDKGGVLKTILIAEAILECWQTSILPSLWDAAKKWAEEALLAKLDCDDLIKAFSPS